MAAAALLALPTAFAQGGAAPAAAAAPTYSTNQLAAITAMNNGLTNQTAAATAARAALIQASLAEPRNNADLQAKVEALRAAEQALANERAAQFVKLQSSADKLGDDLAAAFASAGGRAGGGGRGGGGGGRGGGAPARYDDYTGFVKLWDGATFNNWEGETNVWSIDHEAVHADTTKTPGQHHIHYVGPGAIMKDFNLKVEFKIGGNSPNGGIHYRSHINTGRGGTLDNPLGNPLPAGIHTVVQAQAAGIAGGNPWQISGYQHDLNLGNNYTGQLYEGQGRGIINGPGGIVQMLPGNQTLRLGTANPNPAAAVKPHLGLEGEWNQVEIIARGNTLIHMLNGQVITVNIDDNPTARAAQGIMSLQLEGSGQIWYRNVYVKPVEPPLVLPK